jgi:hypothetical protein
MGAGATIDPARSTSRHPRRTARARLTVVSVLAMLAGLLAAVGTVPAQAAQAPGHDVPAWSNGWAWTYATTFRYQGDGTDVTINENVTYTVTTTETFQGHDAYRMTISGTITGGNGSVSADGINATLSNFRGTVSGTRWVRRSDLALLREDQQQHLDADAKVSFLTQGVTADINLTLNPRPSWKTHDFPLSPGDRWQLDEEIDYNGGFSYDAGSLGGSGSDTFDGTLPFAAPAQVSSATVGVAIGNVATDLISAASADGQTVNNLWYSPTHKNDAREVLQLPLDGATLTMTRNLSAASTPAPGTTVSETVTPSLTCAGGQVTVTGRLSTFAAGVPVTIRLDKSQIAPGQTVSATATTTAGGDYSATLTVPADGDGLAKAGSRANWGVLVSAAGVTNVATVVVTPQNCSTLAYTGATSGPQGGTATVSAKLTDLTGASVGGRQVTFALSGGGSVGATTNGSGVATATIAVPGPPRAATITASYAGSAALASASASSAFAVGKVATATSVTPSESPATVGEPLTFTAFVTPALAGTPGGGVQFAVDGADFGSPVQLAGGSATSAPISTLALGDHTVTATYIGDADFAASTSPSVPFRVRPVLLSTTTTSSVSPGAVVYGQAVELSATVAASGGGATPTGSVTFTDGGTTLGVASLADSGDAALSVSTLPVGSHSIVARYSGDDTYRASTAGPKSLAVAKADVEVQLDSSDTSTVSGESVNFTAAVTPVAPGGGTPVGTVQLEVDGTEVGDPVELTGGSAVFPPVTSLLAGNHSVTAVYGGGTNFQDGSDTLAQAVEQADTTTIVTASPSPSAEGQNVTLAANVSAVAPGSGSPTGTITFTADGDVIGAAPLEAGPGGSEATITLADLPPDSYTVVASYDGDPGYRAGDSAPISHTVLAGVAIVPTTTVATSSTNPSTYGELITFRAAVTADDGSTPTGLVQFSVDGADVGAPVAVDGQGVAESPALASPDPGDHTVIAAFVPDVGFGSSGDIITQTVAAAAVDLTVEASASGTGYGEPVAFTAAVGSQQVGTGTPTGYVQFNVDGQPLGDAVELDDGEATSPTVSDLAPGSHTVTVVYSGDVHFAPAITSLTRDVERIGTSTALATSTTSPTYGQSVVLTATVTPADDALGAPGGTVSFVDGSTTLATVPVAPGAGATGTARVTLGDLGAGAHSIRAVFSGTSAFAASSSAPAAVSVAKRATAIQAEPAVLKLLPLGLPLGQLRITLTTSSGPVGGAPVVFRVGGATVCATTTDGSGVATCSASHLLVQLLLANGYTATFAGDANHLPSAAQGVVLK